MVNICFELPLRIEVLCLDVHGNKFVGSLSRFIQNVVWGSNKFICWLVGSSVKSANSNITSSREVFVNLWKFFFSSMRNWKEEHRFHNTKSFVWNGLVFSKDLCSNLYVDQTFVLDLFTQTNWRTNVEPPKYVNSRVKSILHVS